MISLRIAALESDKTGVASVLQRGCVLVGRRHIGGFLRVVGG